MPNQLRGNWGSEPEDLHRLVKLVAGRLNMGPSVNDVLPLTEAAAAVQRLQSKEGNPIRLVLVP